jgi:hypothetical protein
MAAFLPDVVRYQPGAPAVFEPGGGNGRALDDDSFDIAVQFLAGSRQRLHPAARHPRVSYLSAPELADLPALADLSACAASTPARRHQPAAICLSRQS